MRADGIREQIAALTQQLGEAERELERLRIGRAVVAEVLAEQDTTMESAAGPSAVPVVQAASRWAMVPVFAPNADPAEALAGLPQPYRDVLEAIDDAGEPLRSVDLCRSLGLGVQARVTEAMRGKLNRLVERGWCVSGEPGR
ncbi:hypothetical protein [Catenulispora rubra]|uniref:hypothetical protein n=1 Tax=Catenulispora rubra TaxID=280293 RepID=UPI00189286A2|nr:hypothetical protein [Catenulispora rubra]